MMLRLIRIEVVVAILVAIAIAMSGPGYRLGWWPLGVAFGILRWGAWVAIGLLVAAIVMWILELRHGGMLPAAAIGLSVATVLSIAAAAFPLWLTWTGSHVPPIHDITTDTTNPPRFVAIAPIRAHARNPVAYEGEAIAKQQLAAYPDIQPIVMGTWPTEQAFERALAAARSMGWTIVDSDPVEGRIEASDTTPFFGFVDDVVIRVSVVGSRTRIDIRSLSRIGRSDLGANARRVRRYLAKLMSELAEPSRS